MKYYKPLISPRIIALLSLVLSIVAVIWLVDKLDSVLLAFCLGFFIFLAIWFIILGFFNVFITNKLERKEKAEFYVKCALAGIDMIDESTMEEAKKIASEVNLSSKAQEKLKKSFLLGMKYCKSISSEGIRYDHEAELRAEKERKEREEEEKRKEAERAFELQKEIKWIGTLNVSDEEKAQYVKLVSGNYQPSTSSSSSGKPASVVKRGIVGGIVAGPAGAVVGALSAVDKNNREQNKDK